MLSASFTSDNNCGRHHPGFNFNCDGMQQMFAFAFALPQFAYVKLQTDMEKIQFLASEFVLAFVMVAHMCTFLRLHLHFSRTCESGLNNSMS